MADDKLASPIKVAQNYSYVASTTLQLTMNNYSRACSNSINPFLSLLYNISMKEQFYVSFV